MVATRSLFGLTHGVGVETMREVFSRLRLDMQVGCAPWALRGVMHALEPALWETAAAWEHEGQAAGERRPIIGAVDATFWERMMWVFRDLVSGDLVCEEVAEDRSYDTWHARVKARREVLGVEVRSLVRDRAKALMKLAATGLEGLRMPEVLHLIHALVQSSALSMGRRVRHTRQALQQAQEQRSGAEAQQAQAVVEARAAEVTHWEAVHSVSRHHLERVSLTRHPWRVFDSPRQRSEEGARQ